MSSGTTIAPARASSSATPALAAAQAMRPMQFNADGAAVSGLRLPSLKGVANCDHAAVTMVSHCSRVHSIRTTATLPHIQKARIRSGLWVEKLPQGLVVFALPSTHQKRLRTSNATERVNQEIKRRTRVASLFPNEASLLRLVSALLAETSAEWETGKVYLNMEYQNPPSV
jgi:hypothetical protein